jgi:hypothetical protein
MGRASRQVDVPKERGDRNPAPAAPGAKELAIVARAGNFKLTEPKLLPDEKELRRDKPWSWLQSQGEFAGTGALLCQNRIVLQVLFRREVGVYWLRHLRFSLAESADGIKG